MVINTTDINKFATNAASSRKVEKSSVGADMVGVLELLVYHNSGQRSCFTEERELTKWRSV